MTTDQSEVGYTFDDINSIAKDVLQKTQHRPTIGIICGSGLGGLADKVDQPDVVHYHEIKEFPVATVQGHEGKLVFGKLEGKTVVLMRGRFHYYEGYPMWKVAMPVRVMKAMGISTLIVTNAAGGLNPEFNTGDLMILRDHIDLPGLTGECVLIGRNDERFGPRFPATVGTYDDQLIKQAKAIAQELGYGPVLREGVYIMIGGPTFETVAESRLLRNWGADAVGMSTVPEAVVAKHCGLKVFGISLITDMCSLSYDAVNATTHEEVLKIGQKRAGDLQKLVSCLIGKIQD
ncbi:hypothetical protein LOTGIDRAFT_161701 [Lottia gigantea]|uniref:Purine nucleoside phosphorylase n=1 Tax=Lottia gigantea TaxID=225164 RepID=V4AEM1_LOTGI|nr:hypothetical protein LOTGIDRAFT_161701 [Lottia gigantea]ESO93590.1 hypothetical protein LOTGIDRAFT_161701 [Lottia gigantea]